MNIFKALSMGKGRINEENMSAMLGYLLSPRQPHGLGDLFLKRFLETISTLEGCAGRFNVVIDSIKPIDAEILLEVPYSYVEKKWFIDLEIQIYERDKQLNEEKNESHRILIENKIRPQAANTLQLKHEFLAVLEDFKDQQGDIYTEYSLLNPGTIKPTDPGEIKDSIDIYLSNANYRIEQYDSTAIRIFNLDTQENEVALPMLRKINNEFNLNVETHFKGGHVKNTRHFGRDIIRAIKQKRLEVLSTNEASPEVNTPTIKSYK